ncbi:MAG: hypothetical protein GWP10_14190 [Nitrospiraceae bacterium]|nr:hypothetical protein [Nitrospiraceae bacterium]
MNDFIDLTGTIMNGMWRYPSSYIAPTILKMQGEIAWNKRWLYYGKEIHMSTVKGMYFETSAHMFTTDIAIEDIPVSEMVHEAVIVKAPKTHKGFITLNALKNSLAKQKENVKEGESILIATG